MAVSEARKKVVLVAALMLVAATVAWLLRSQAEEAIVGVIMRQGPSDPASAAAAEGPPATIDQLLDAYLAFYGLNLAQLRAMTPEQACAAIAAAGLPPCEPDTPESRGWTNAIPFPDGSVLEVAVARPHRLYRDAAKERDYGPRLAELERAAGQGDARAATTVADLLRRCSTVPADPADYQAGEIRLRESLAAQGIDPTPALERYYRTYDACLSVPASQRNEASRWLRLATELGDPEAPRQLAMDQLGTYAGFVLLRQAWEAGNADVLLELSRAYEHGWASPDGKPDPAMAYAYSYLAHYIWTPPPTRERPGFSFERRNAHLTNARPLADPAARDAALMQARDLLLSNPNCCVRPL